MKDVLSKVMHRLRAEPVACQGVVQSGLAAMVGFGLLTWTAEQTGLVLALSAALLGMMARSQVSPTVNADVGDSSGTGPNARVP